MIPEISADVTRTAELTRTRRARDFSGREAFYLVHAYQTHSELLYILSYEFISSFRSCRRKSLRFASLFFSDLGLLCFFFSDLLFVTAPPLLDLGRFLRSFEELFFLIHLYQYTQARRCLFPIAAVRPEAESIRSSQAEQRQ